MIMQDVLGLLAFVGLIAAWFLAVVFVGHDAQTNIETERVAEPKLPHHAHTWSISLSAQG